MPKKICLNMIVKDEAHVIEDCFNCVLKYIDFWVICDTGSTDGTQQIILDYFKKHDKPGKLIQHEWYDDFGRSRTLAIQACKGAFSSRNPELEDQVDISKGFQTFGIRRMTHCDYAFVMDADDTIEGNLVLPSNLNKDSYRFKFGQTQTYFRELMFSLKQDWCYMGVLHEYVSCTTKHGFSRYALEGDYYVVSGRTGGRSKNPKKYLKDAENLVRGIELEKGTRLADRYTFYAGQSYFDYKDYENAIKYYTIASSLDGISHEEKYYSKYQIAVSKEVLNYPLDDIVQAYTEAYEYNKIRAEPMLRLSIVYSSKKAHQEAYDCISKVKDLKFPQNQFFVVNKLAYDYLVKDQLGLCATRLEKYQEAFDIFNSILSSTKLNNILSESERLIFEKKRNVVTGQIKDQTTIYNSLRVSQIKNSMKKNKNNRIILTITTCKRLDLFKKTVNSILNCFEDANVIDNWICVDDNSSSEDRAEMKKLYPFFEFIFKSPEEKGHSRSMNIIRSRALKAKYLIHLEDDWHFFVKREYIKPAIAVIEQFGSADIPISGEGGINQVLFNRNYSEILKDVVIPGGHVNYIKNGIYKGTRFIIHEHHTPGSEGLNDFNKRYPKQGSSAYWPHYSLRPSVIRCNIFEKIGEYNKSASHFEMEYANRYFSKGFKSAFYDGVNCLHTGRLTSERKTEKENAYTLNNEPQFEEANTTLASANYVFFKGLDSHGDDIKYTQNNRSFEELVKEAESTPGCVAFNSLGYLKQAVKDPSQFINLSNPESGLYVNIKRVSNLLECAKLTARSFKLDITFTITTCKRYDLFERTMNHFLQRCKDIDKIKKWICIDDYSSEDDIEKMKKNYPFFDFIFKSENTGEKGHAQTTSGSASFCEKGHAQTTSGSASFCEKGHAQSLNKLFDLVTTKYVLFFEDDWVCNEDFKVSDIYNFLESSDYVQVLMRSANGQHPVITTELHDGITYFDYQYNHYHATKPEINIDYDRQIAEKSEYSNSVQETSGHSTSVQGNLKFEPDKQRSFKGWWWPGFTLNPNVFNFEKIKEIMKNKPLFDEEIRVELFEYDFSMKCFEAGIKVAYSNFQIEHIGTETSAYKLNGFGRYYE
ncbi:hypothetical protein OAG24_00875 [bacterium]|nr:hypothetical protein [bacterium]